MTAPTDEPVAPASYEFTDGSLIRPAMTRVWFARLFPLLPRWLAANVLTLLSTGALLVILALSVDPARWSPGLFAVAYLVTLQIYVAGDHLDGMQAKASGTASPLGDFLDHFCDLWAGSILIVGFWSMLGDASRSLLYAMLAILILGFAATFAEREERQRLHFTTVGTLEAIVVLTAFLLSWIVPGARGWWRTDLVAGFPRYGIIIGLGMSIAVGAILVIVRRMRGLPAPTLLFGAGLMVLAVGLTRRVELPPLAGWLLMIVYGGSYVARVMHGYLVRESRSRPDVVGVGAVVAFSLWVILGAPSVLGVRSVCLVIGGYLGVVLTMTLWRIWRNLCAYWVWVNPGRS